MSYESDMQQAEADRLAIGANFPPTHAQLSIEEMRQALAPFAERRDQFLRSMGNAKVRTRAEAGQATDLLGMGRKFVGLIHEEREKITQPLYEAQRAVIATCENWLEEMITKAGDPRLPAGDERNADTVHGLIKDWQAAEDKRVADQRREQAEAEARLREAAAPAPPPEPVDDPVGEAHLEQRSDGNAAVGTGRARLEYGSVMAPSTQGSAPEGVQVETPKAAPIRGDYGHTLRSQAKATARVIDVKKVPKDILTSDVVIAAICKVAEAQYKHRKTIAGVEFTLGSTNRIS